MGAEPPPGRTHKRLYVADPLLLARLMPCFFPSGGAYLQDCVDLFRTNEWKSVARKVFHSFRYLYDSQRVQQVRNIGALEGQSSLSANEWEDKKKAGEAAVKAWIDEKLKGRSCVIVLIGAHTNDRKWIQYEMTEAWNKGKGVLGIRIHKLKNLAGDSTTAGPNPLNEIAVGDKKLSAICKTYDPPGATSTGAYKHIADNIEGWVEKAIEIRNSY